MASPTAAPREGAPAAGRTGLIGFALLYLAFCISYVDRAAMSLALAQVGREFGLGAADLGIVLSAFFLGYAVMQVPGGWLADRFGSKAVVVVTIGLWSLFTVATSLAWSLASLVAIRFVFGLAEGGFPPASLKAVSELFGREARPKWSSVLVSSNYAGSMIAPLIMAPLILAFGWRHAFEIVGGGGLAFALVYVVAVPHRPAAPATDPGPQASAAPTRALLRNSFLWRLLVVWFGLSCVNKGLDSWMPIYLLQERGLDLKAVGLLTPIPFLLATASTASGGWIMTRFFKDREKYLLLGSAALTGLFLFAMYRAETIAGVIGFQCAVYVFKSFVTAAVIALPTKVLPESQIGTGIGMINFGGQSAGFVAPLAMGLLVSGFGTYDAAFGFLIAMTLLSVAAAATLRAGRPELAERFA